MSMIKLPDNPATINKTLLPKTLFDADTISSFGISEVNWIMSIKPDTRNVRSYISGRKRLEEIEVFRLKIERFPDKENCFNLFRQLHGKIMYPCVVFLDYRDKYKISTWNFVDTVSGNNGVVLRSPYVSAWIRDPATSANTKRCVDKVVDILLNGEGSIKKLYEQICNAVLNCEPRYLGSRTHLSKILYDLTGQKNHPIIAEIDSRKRYVVKDKNSRFQKNEYGSQYKYSYDYEDIWCVFMEDDGIRRVIENRRYRDMEDLVMEIDMKYEEHPDRW